MDIINYQPHWVIILLILWILPWKGYALWLASKRDSKIWFIVLLVLNTVAILEIIYIFYVVKKTPGEVLDAIANLFKRKNTEKVEVKEEDKDESKNGQQ